MTIFHPGRRLFSVAAILMIVQALLHGMGGLQTVANLEPADAKVFDAMAALKSPLGLGMSPSLKDIYWDIWFTLSIAFVALGLLNLAAASIAAVPTSAIRRLTWVNAASMAAYAGLAFHYQVPPPLICAVVIGAVLLAALLIPDPALSATAS